MKLRFQIKYTSHTSLYTHGINSILSCVELNKYIKKIIRTEPHVMMSKVMIMKLLVIIKHRT